MSIQTISETLSLDIPDMLYFSMLDLDVPSDLLITFPANMQAAF